MANLKNEILDIELANPLEIEFVDWKLSDLDHLSSQYPKIEDLFKEMSDINRMFILPRIDKICANDPEVIKRWDFMWTLDKLNT